MNKLKQLIEKWNSGATLDRVYARELEETLREMALDADWYWDDRDLDGAYATIEDCTSYDDVGDEVTLRPIIELPEITVRVTEDGHEPIH